MRTVLMIAVLGMTGLAGVAAAEAQDGRSCRRDDAGRGPRVEVRRHGFREFFSRFRSPRYERVWVPARYESRIVGDDPCGRPIHRSVCVSEGHWTRRLCR